MTQNFRNFSSADESDSEAEATLRLVSKLPPPAGLEDRVHARVHRNLQVPARRGFWSLWMPAQRLQFAGAAALVLAIAGSTWGVYHSHPQKSANDQTKTLPPVTRSVPSGSFGSAGAERVPPTLAPIKVPPVPKKKPSASKRAKAAAKPSPKTMASDSSQPR